MTMRVQENSLCCFPRRTALTGFTPELLHAAPAPGPGHPLDHSGLTLSLRPRHTAIRVYFYGDICFVLFLFICILLHAAPALPCARGIRPSGCISTGISVLFFFCLFVFCYTPLLRFLAPAAYGHPGKFLRGASVLFFFCLLVFCYTPLLRFLALAAYGHPWP